MEGEASGVPAGWYPDPLGLPQLRWWDGAQWSEFTSEPAAPAMSEPEPESTVARDEQARPADGSTASSFDDPLADFLNGNIARSGATGVNPVVQAGEPFPSAAPVAAAPPADLPPVSSAPAAGPGVPGANETMEAPHVIGYDDDGREFLAPVVPIVTTPGAAPVPPGGEPPAPPQPEPAPPMAPQPPEPRPEPQWSSAPPIPDGAVPAAPQPAAPEPLIVAPQAADPFASATSTVYGEDPESGETFGSRRARRQFERQREIEAPEPPVPGRAPMAEPPYSGAVTAPVMIQRTAPAEPEVVQPFPVAPVPPTYPTPAAAAAPGAPAEPDTDQPPAPGKDKPTYSGASYLLAFLGIFPAAVIALLVVVLGLGDDHGLIWGVWGAAWLSGILLAFYDRLKLKSWGHANTANPLLAVFTPILYLVARNTATKGETGHGRKVLVYWIVALLVMAAIVYLVPQVMEATIPGFTATWDSPLRP